MDDRLLGIYLNDHLAGATAGLELAKRVAGRNRNNRIGTALSKIAGEIEDDRATLRDVMGRLGATPNVAKTTAAWIAERAGRMKLNGHLLTYSPLSRVEELEALRLGVEGKHALWRTLMETRAGDPRLEGVDLEALATKARRQADELERLRIEAAKAAFTGSRTKG